MSGPYKQRTGKKRPRKVGDIRALQRMLWRALIEAEHILIHSEDVETSLKAIHAISTAGGGYAKLLEATELDTRLHKVEATLAEGGHRNGQARMGVS
jgi:hypothetical protein